MPEVTRRTLLAFAAVASVVEPSLARSDANATELRARIAAHEEAYAALLQIVHQSGSTWQDRKTADRVEQQALLAICCHPTTGSSERRAKAEYLLKVEARGELDLEEHMQALLHSMQS
ncbi:hypothetical protein FJV76_19290 [Mesorhizobium sp. WSM4303]|uniref:hypothetical protein n=1 Tax=unclassified Mesorhizobium TaxID=325217 RepID=UPI00115F1E40|nr:MULTISPECIES: hypothetical protein [unclassified Mesorhizobium]TRC93129.1 hypothetical protein FJV77_23200 [Mesorhizobium sp. WSM4306]TRD02383.1 hypothetical protein FJV76_19290 [Mesorhizobium sp. WSM4303]